MILTTSQSQDFDITKDLVDLSKSPNLLISNDVFLEAYKWLFDKLSHDKWIWCYKEGDRNYLNHGCEHVLWTLDVPDSECVFINESIWEHVINKWAYDKDIDEDINFVINDGEYDKFVELHKGKEESTWGDIFNITEKSGVQILVKSPILDKYVIKKEWKCDYDTSFDEMGIVSYYFDNKNSLLEVKNIYESGLRGRKKHFTTKIDEYKVGFGLKIEW